MELVRKQIYITPVQDRAEKLLARQKGTTEAEIIRKALNLLRKRPRKPCAFKPGMNGSTF